MAKARNEKPSRKSKVEREESKLRLARKLGTGKMLRGATMMRAQRVTGGDDDLEDLEVQR